MDHSTETAAMVALLRHGKQPAQPYADLIENAGSALTVLEQECTGNGAQASLFPADTGALLDAAEQEIADWTKTGIELLTVLDPGYPDNLRAVHDRPPLLF